MVSLGELLVEFVRVRRGVMHDVADLYMGPFPSGAPAITADSASRLGLRVGFTGVVGADDFGVMVVNRLRGDGVDVSRIIIDNDSVTGLAFVAYDESGLRRFVFNLKWSASVKLSPSLIEPSYIADSRVLHVSGSTMYIGEGPREACIKAMVEARRAGALVSLDPNIRVELMSINATRELLLSVLKLVNILLISEDEVKSLMGSGNAIEEARRLLEKGPEVVVVKRGVNGSIALTRGGEHAEGSFRVNEVDPTGAGDVFNAAFIYGYLKDWGISETLRFANAAAAIKVTRMGPMEGPRNIEEVYEVLRSGGTFH